MNGPWPSARAGNSTLSRLVSFSSRPWSSHVPALPRWSRALSSSAVGAANVGGAGGALAGVSGAPSVRSLCHTASRAAFTSSLVRPVFTDAGCSSGFQPGSAKSSFLCSSSHCSLPLRASVPPDQQEPPLELLAGQIEVQLAAGDGGRRVTGARRRPRAAVPHDHVAAAVLAARDHALEVGVLDRVVLHLHGQDARRRVQRRPLGHGPAHQHAVQLEPQVVVQAPGPVPLHDELPDGRQLRVAGFGSRLGPGLRGRPWPDLWVSRLAPAGSAVLSKSRIDR